MDVRHAAGFVLFTQEAGERRYLLLRNARHGTWGFPKGHRDPGEDDMTCARRELAEETGLSEITVLDGFERVAEHVVRGDEGSWRKVVRYFLARCDPGETAISEEHSDARWLPVDRALETLRFDGLRDVLRAAHAWHRSH